MNRTENFYANVRAANRQAWDAINNLQALQREFNALDYGNTLPAGEGINEGITKVELGAVVFATSDAFVTLLNTGHATNMAKLL